MGSNVALAAQLADLVRPPYLRDEDRGNCVYLPERRCERKGLVGSDALDKSRRQGNLQVVIDSDDRCTQELHAGAGASCVVEGYVKSLSRVQVPTHPRIPSLRTRSPLACRVLAVPVGGADRRGLDPEKTSHPPHGRL